MIRNYHRFAMWLPAGFDGQFDWDFLNFAWEGTRIQPMDFDAVVERKGHKLIFETKSHGNGIPQGQMITLTNEWHNHSATIIHVEGKSAPEISGVAVYSEWDEKKKEFNIGDYEIKPATAEDVLYIARRWFCRVEGKTAETREEWDAEMWASDEYLKVFEKAG